MKSNTLVIMAAGMGSRFGGLKQIEPIDDDGNFILHYSAYDAYKAGFRKIVFVIKEENLELFKEKVSKKLEKFIDVEYAFQKKDDIPVSDDFEERVKPWGTAHAIYCTKNYVDGSFAVINADDFYGSGAYKMAHDRLNDADEMDEGTCIAYPFMNTIWGSEKVKRAVIKESNGYISDLIESSIEARENTAYATPLDTSIAPFDIPLDQPVSMNMFVLPHKIYDVIYEEMVEFFSKDRETILKGEILIPNVLKRAIEEKVINMKAPSTQDVWMGMTYREDLDKIKDKIKEYKEKGIYPEHIFVE